jgi:RNAse (barnase) inhibitor barstar
MAAHGPQISLATHLQSSKPPWTALLVLKAGQRADSAVNTPGGFLRRVISGAHCRSTSGLFAEMARGLEFPDYFGHNWDALEECLADLEWLPAKGYIVLFTDAQLILPDDEEEFATFLEVLSDAGEAWASGQAGREGKGPIPFHTLLTVAERDEAKLRRWGLPQISAVAARPSGRRPRNSR